MANIIQDQFNAWATLYEAYFNDINDRINAVLEGVDGLQAQLEGSVKKKDVASMSDMIYGTKDKWMDSYLMSLLTGQKNLSNLAPFDNLSVRHTSYDNKYYVDGLGQRYLNNYLWTNDRAHYFILLFNNRRYNNDPVELGICVVPPEKINMMDLVKVPGEDSYYLEYTDYIDLFTYDSTLNSKNNLERLSLRRAWYGTSLVDVDTTFIVQRPEDESPSDSMGKIAFKRQEVYTGILVTSNTNKFIRQQYYPDHIN